MNTIEEVRWARAMQEAIRPVLSQIYHANSAARRWNGDAKRRMFFNRAIRKWNHEVNDGLRPGPLKQEQPELARKPLLPRPKLDPEAARILQHESESKMRLNRVAPEEWLRRISGIEDEAQRQRVACLVWWDYFSKRQWRFRWPHLDVFLAVRCVEMPEDRIAAGLQAVGYTPTMAAWRALGEVPEDVR